MNLKHLLSLVPALGALAIASPAAIAHALLTLLGAAGERRGLDPMLKVNTVKRRTLSLYKQGCFWYDAIPAMPDHRLLALMTA